MTSPARITALMAASVSAALLLAAAWFEHVEGLAPCALCLWQRWPHRLVVVLGVLAALRPHRGILYLQALTLMAGAAIAFWHGGVELGLLPGLPSCGGGNVLTGDDVSAVLDNLLAAPAPACDEIPWSFLGLSMAVWNGIISLALAGFVVLKTAHDRR